MNEWFGEDDFWRTFGSCMFYDERFEQAEHEIGAIIQLAGIRVARVLDVGCGPGRHAIPFAATGIAVTGVDASESLLAQGRQRAAAEDVAVEWVHDDMRAFSRPGHFELVLSMWTSFGYFDDRDDDRRVLSRCFENLAPGGVLVLDTVSTELIVRDVEPVHLTEYDDGRILVERPLVTDRMTRYENEWLLIEGDRVHRATWHHNLYSAGEFQRLLAEAGFVDVALHGGLDGSPYDLEAERLVLIARKPA